MDDRPLNGSRCWLTAKAPRADAALYWRAYSLDKLNRQAEALTSVAELLKGYPSSRWLADARALEIQVRQRAGQPVSPEVQADEELKLFAIQGLQHQDPEQAIPMLEKLLQGTSSPRLKERALFVLAQSNAARARQVMTTVARGGSNPDLQMKAIQYIGMQGSQPNRQLLGEIYTSSTDVDVKRQILRAYMMAGDRERVLAAATEREVAAAARGSRAATRDDGRPDEVWQLYQKETDARGRRPDDSGPVHGWRFDSSPRGRQQRCESRPETPGDSASRDDGTRADGRCDPEHLQPPDGRRREGAAIDALFIQQNAETLVALARKETDRDLKRRIVAKLALMPSPAARDYMLELLK